MKHMLTSLIATGTLAAGAVNAADLTLVHGIDGTDLGLDQALPVDIFIDGTCLPGITFGTIATLDVEARRYPVTVRLADAQRPCRGPLAASTLEFVNFGTSTALVAHLDDNQQITLSSFGTDVVATGMDTGRVVVRHTADAPTVDVLANGAPLLTELSNGEQAKGEVPAATYLVAVAPTGETDPVFGPVPLPVNGDTTTVVYAVGSLRNGSFTVLVQEVAQ